MTMTMTNLTMLYMTSCGLCCGSVHVDLHAAESADELRNSRRHPLIASHVLAFIRQVHEVASAQPRRRLAGCSGGGIHMHM